MVRSVAEELIEVLKKKKADFISLSNLKKVMPAALRKRLELTDKSNGTLIEKALLPHLDETLMIKRVSKMSAYLAFKQPDEVLLFRIVQKLEGKKPSANNIPFKQDEYLSILNRMLEQGMIRVSLGKDSKKTVVPLLFTADIKPVGLPSANKSNDVSEEKFKETYFELERGNFYIRICDLRRCLGWGVQEFDAMLAGLRDAGKIQLQTGDMDFFTEDDIRESFTDENGFRKLTMMWRQ